MWPRIEHIYLLTLAWMTATAEIVPALVVRRAHTNARIVDLTRTLVTLLSSEDQNPRTIDLARFYRNCRLSEDFTSEDFGAVFLA